MLRSIFFVLLLVAPGVAQEATFTDVTILRVVDGDTWDVRAALPVGVSFEVRLRPIGLDCAEVWGDTREEGLEQTAVLEELLMASQEHKIVVYGKDAFGRWLVEAWADTVEVVPYMLSHSCETWRP